MDYPNVMSYLRAVNDAVCIATKAQDQLENAGAKAFHGSGDVRMPAFGHDRESTPEFELRAFRKFLKIFAGGGDP